MSTADIRRLLERVEPGARKAHKRHVMACALDGFERDGIEATTIDDIRAAADSSTGSIYHHFGNKDGLIAALFFAALDDQTALVEPRIAAATTAREAVEATVVSYMEWVSAQPRLARFMYKARAVVTAGPAHDDLAARNKARHRELLAWLVKGVERGEIRALPRETYVSLLIGQSENYCRAWLAERIKAKPSEHAAVFAEAAWRSIAA
jgi:AcrR family transcriptional regulator